jgi:hypothetical protein
LRRINKYGENITHKEILLNPVTEEEATYPEAFEAKRK